MSSFYVTTSIPYVNAEPHIGHAMEFVIADVLARYARQQGIANVLFSTGTDEHGGKIAEKAAEAGVTPQAYTDQLSESFKALLKELHISNDRFIRTTDATHEQRAQIIWKNLSKDIYKGSYTGLYCTGCESFVSEKVAKENNGVCPAHNRPYEQIKEENYFFKLSAYTEKIAAAIKDGTFTIVPDKRKNEILSVLAEGLDDISISRPKASISWGIPVPGDDTQVMYVWFDALMNYITVLGYPEHTDFSTYWPANVQVIGKDILRFHAAIWPGMLLALGLPIEKTLYVHGFVTMNGQKMSKTLGNTVAPHDIIKAYGVDAFRYYFLRHIPSYNDGDFSWTKLHAVYTNELGNELGNAAQRVTAMIQKYQNGLIGEIPKPEHDTAQYHDAIAVCRFDRALEEVWDKVRGLNQYIDEEKPWEIAKRKDEDHLREVLAYCVSSLIQIAELLEPFLPDTAQKLLFSFNEGVLRPQPESLFPRKDPPEGVGVTTEPVQKGAV